MRKLLIVGAVGLLLGACGTLSPGGGPGPGASLEQKIGFARAACFEVVAEKTPKDSLSYDKPLNWDSLSYAARNEKYVPLGTAFAIGPEELVTAAHVLGLTSDSLVFRSRFIREKVREDGKTVERVHEIDKIIAFDNDRDYVVFTVKGRTFDTWLSSGGDPSFNTKVYTAGDAYGEGIVVRDGILLDAVPETETGTWDLLKSSIATNPGSSGGPLLNERFEVIGIVQSRKDDFCYSLPMGEIVRGTAVVHTPQSLAFSVFRTRKPVTLDASWPLPMGYGDLMRAHAERYMEFYLKGMDALLSENEADMFPRGPNSEQALFAFYGSTMPQIYLQDTTTKTWFSTQLDPSLTDIGNGGSVGVAEIYKDEGVWLLRLDAPDDLSVRRLWDDPKVTMDTLLKAINITRKLGTSDTGSRVVSYGAPIETQTHTDRFGRPWQTNMYLLEYADQVVITCATPTPRGLAMLYVSRYTSQREYWLYDIRRLTDFVNVSYGGTLARWEEFLANPEFRRAAMKDVTVSWKEGEAIDVATRDVSCRIPQGLIDVTADSEVFLLCSVFLEGGAPVFGVRKFAADSGDENDSYYLWYRWSRPTAALPKAMKDSWQNNVLDRGHPYSGRVYTENGLTNLGTLHPAWLEGGKASVSGDWAVTLFLAAEGTESDDAMQRHLETYAAGTAIRK